MSGSIQGATLCKTMLPWSRLPGYMIGASIVFCLPMFMALLAVIYQLVGDFYCMAAFFSLLLSLLVWLPLGDLSHESAEDDPNGMKKGVLAPQSHTAATAEFTCRGRISNLFKLLTLLFLVLFIRSAMSELEKDEKDEMKSTFVSSLDDLMLVGLGCVFDVFGKSYLAFVFCADVTTEIIGYISRGDDSDGPEGTGHDPSVLRRAEMADIGVLRDGIAAVSNGEKTWVAPPAGAPASGRQQQVSHPHLIST